VVDHVSPHRQAAWASIARRIGPLSPNRVQITCTAHGCGGCPWQHLEYSAQLELKRRRVTEALTCLTRPPVVAPIVAAPTTSGYRTKGKYVVGPNCVLGAYLPRSHRVASTLGCQVVTPAIDHAAALAQAVLAQSPLLFYNEATRRGQLRYVVLRCNRENRVLVVIVTTSKTPHATMLEVAETLCADDSINGVVWLRNDTTSGVILEGSEEPQPLVGETCFYEEIAGVEIAVGATEFLQINREQAARLYSAVVELSGANAGTRAIDLYCGVGGISFALARAGARVLGIESQARAVVTARAAAARSGCERVDFRAGEAGDIIALAADLAPSLVVVNPPRKGLDDATHTALDLLAPATLVYVSCEPTSLGRDLSTLATHYRIEHVQPFDLMPATSKIETVVICRK
jgi:23S rRNA (uracil-5-)-methyltransferase RumA